MAAPKVGTFTTGLVPLPAENVDTDQIVPARYLKVIDKAGLAKLEAKDRPLYRLDVRDPAEYAQGHLRGFRHAAGGQLVLLTAARKTLKASHPLASAAPLPITGVVSIDGITDLAGYAGTTGCNAAVPQLMGGMPPQQLDRYALMSPSELVPLQVRYLKGCDKKSYVDFHQVQLAATCLRKLDHQR